MNMFLSAAPTIPPPSDLQMDQTRTETHTHRRVEVTIEREWAREWVANTTPAPFITLAALCTSCGSRVSMLTPTAAAGALQVSVRTIYRWAEERRLHFIESPAGELYLCARSVQARLLDL